MTKEKYDQGLKRYKKALEKFRASFEEYMSIQNLASMGAWGAGKYAVESANRMDRIRARIRGMEEALCLSKSQIRQFRQEAGVEVD